jgi:hypothetical protein
MTRILYPAEPVAYPTDGVIYPTEGGAATFPTSGPAVLGISSPAEDAVLPINTATVINGTCPAGSELALYLVYPTVPIGNPVVVGTTWSLSYTPDLLDHGSYTLTIDDGTDQVERDVRVTAVFEDGTWSTNTGAYYDFRFSLAEETPGTEPASIAPLEGTGTLAHLNAPLVRTDVGARRALEFVAATAQSSTATTGSITTTPNGITTSLIMWWFVNWTSGSSCVGGWGKAASTQDFFKLADSAGRVLSSLQRDTFGEATQTAAFAYDLDSPAQKRRLIFVEYDGTAEVANLYIVSEDGLTSDTNNPRALAHLTVTLASDLYRIAAWPLNSNAQNASGFYQACGAKRVTSMPGSAGAQALYDWLVASDLPAPVGAPIMWLWDSLGSGPVTTGGFRKLLADYISSELLAIDQVGPKAGGSFLDNQHCCYGGNTLVDQIDQQIDISLGTGNGFEGTLLVLHGGGTNDVDVGGMDLATLETRYKAALQAIRDKLDEEETTAPILVQTFPRYLASVDPVAAGLVASVNAVINDWWDDHETDNPTAPALFRFDLFGNTTDGNMDGDGRHMLQANYDGAFAALLAASNGTITLADYLAVIG